jgi:putative transposase
LLRCYKKECLLYIDLNMVMAGAVTHPAEWAHCGYQVLQSLRKRNTIIDRSELTGLVGVLSGDLERCHGQWIEDAITRDRQVRQKKWT